MTLLSNKSKYALHALKILADEYQNGPVLIVDIAHQADIPKKFLEQILLELKHNGILQSKKGRGGGYFLRQNPDTVTIGRVIRVLDGPVAPVPCVSETAYGKCDECLDERTCGIRLVMKDVRDAIVNILDTTTISDMLHRIETVEAAIGSS